MIPMSWNEAPYPKILLSMFKINSSWAGPYRPPAGSFSETDGLSPWFFVTCHRCSLVISSWVSSPHFITFVVSGKTQSPINYSSSKRAILLGNPSIQCPKKSSKITNGSWRNIQFSSFLISSSCFLDNLSSATLKAENPKRCKCPIWVVILTWGEDYPSFFVEDQSGPLGLVHLKKLEESYLPPQLLPEQQHVQTFIERLPRMIY